MNRHLSLIVCTVLIAVSLGRAQDPAASSGTTNSERPTSGLKALKNAARRDPATIAMDLTSPETRDRVLAAQALGRLGSSAHTAVQSLVEALTDYATFRDESGLHVVSVEAALALRQVDPKAPVPPKTLARLLRTASAPPEHQLVQGGWVARCGAQAEALSTLATLGPLAQSTLPELARLNRKPCTEGRAYDAAMAIGPLAPDQLSRLTVFLGDADSEARRSVAEYIGEAHIAGATAALGRAMNDTSSAVRLAALQSLEKLHPEGEGRVPLVKPFLQDESPQIRQQALHLLLQLAPDGNLTLSLLNDLLKDPDPSIVLESAQAIARVQPRHRTLLEALVRLAKGPDTDSGLQAAEMLKTSGSRDPKVVEALEPYRERERRQLMEKALLTSTPEERATNGRTLRVNAIRIAKGIKEEQPDHSGRVFSTGDKRLYCWSAVSVANAPAALRHVWYLDGKPVYETTIVVATPASHVWSSRHIKPGKWRVEVTAPGSSNPLSSAAFTVTKN